MKLPASLIGMTTWVRSVLRTHRTLAILIVALFVAAGSGRMLQGSLTSSSPIVFGGPDADKDDPLRACSGQHTMFQDYETIAETQQAYTEAMSEVFAEHEKILRTPSEWKCAVGESAEPSLPKAQALAALLPGWHVVPVTDGPAVERPITFTGFSSLVGELQREYECKLVELQDRSLAEISRNQDQAPGSFCCTEQGCMKSGIVTCTGPVTSDPFCDQACPIVFTTTDIATRLDPYNESINTERQRSRTAVERSLFALRAADMHYELARQLLCYQRASLDLRNELSLTADAISCMPKIWDALTSLHDVHQ